MIDIAQYVAYDIPMTVSVPCHFDSKLPGDRYRIKAVIPPYRCDLWSNKQVKQRQKMIKEPSPDLNWWLKVIDEMKEETNSNFFRDKGLEAHKLDF